MWSVPSSEGHHLQHESRTVPDYPKIGPFIHKNTMQNGELNSFWHNPELKSWNWWFICQGKNSEWSEAKLYVLMQLTALIAAQQGISLPGHQTSTTSSKSISLPPWHQKQTCSPVLPHKWEGLCTLLGVIASIQIMLFTHSTCKLNGKMTHWFSQGRILQSK